MLLILLLLTFRDFLIGFSYRSSLSSFCQNAVYLTGVARPRERMIKNLKFAVDFLITQKTKKIKVCIFLTRIKAVESRENKIASKFGELS